MEQYNVAQALTEMANQAPFQPAIIFPAGHDHQGRSRHIQLSFMQLNTLCDHYAHGLSQYGLQKGERTLMMVRPGIDLIAIAFALLKIGAVPILIDPGMGRKAFLQCVSETEPSALIGVPWAHSIRHLFPKWFQNLKKEVVVGKYWWGKAPTLKNLLTKQSKPFPAVSTLVDDEAAVAFTSGSTGIPKGVVYRSGMFQAQIAIMKNEMQIKPGEVHLSAVYIFALFNPALGVTTVIPDMDPAQTAKLNPALLVDAIQTHGVTMSLGSPTIWKKVSAYCLSHQINLPSIKHIFMFGAPVAPELIRQFASILVNGKIYTPFGATEALPITMISGEEILEKTSKLTEQGAGVCVGTPIGKAEIRIIPISEQIIPTWDDSLSLPHGQIGEIVVKGPVVTSTYLNRPAQTKAAKVYTPTSFWHRMGDTGYLDQDNRLWFCGRKSHRVETLKQQLLPVQCEAVFNQHPEVSRTALVGLGEYGRQVPILIVETLKPSKTKQKIIQELLELGTQYKHTREIKTILFHPCFPVDVRHNAKIKRNILAQWAARRLA